MTSLTHDDVFDELGAFALGAVPDAQRAAMDEHIRHCLQCRAELVAMQTAVAGLARAVPTHDLAPDRAAAMRERLLNRARAVAPADSSLPPQSNDRSDAPASTSALDSVRPISSAPSVATKKALPARHSAGRAWSWMASAAGLVAVASVAQLVRVTHERNSLRDMLAAAANAARVGQSRVVSLQDELAQRDSVISAVTGNDVVAVSLAAQRAQTLTLAHMYWDRQTNRWTMIVRGMPQPQAGKTFEVWLVTKDTKIPAGTFKPDSAGHALMQATYALDRDALRMVAVTEEPEGGVPQPTGPLVAAGAVPVS